MLSARKMVLFHCFCPAASIFTNQTLAQLELWQHAERYENRVYTLPKHLDEMVAKLHLEKIGVELDELNDKQAAYIGVKKTGPYKPEAYRY